MKNLFRKYKLGLWVLVAVAMLLPSSCIEDSESAVEGKGQNRFRVPSGTFSLVAFDAQPQTRTVLEVFRDAVSNGELNKSASVDFELSQAVLDAYNLEHDTQFEILGEQFYDFNGIEGSTISFPAGEFSKQIAIDLKPEGLDFSKQYVLPFLFKNPSSGYGISATSTSAIVQVTVKNRYDGVYSYTGHIGRYDAASCALIELGGDVVPGVSLTLNTTGANSVSTVFLWATGSVIGGIGSSQTITIDPVTNAVTLTANGASPANWGPIAGQPNYYDPATGDIYVSWRWNVTCGGAAHGYIRHIRVKLIPK